MKCMCLKLVGNISVILLLMASTTYGQQSDASYLKGKSYLKEKNFEAAIQSFTEAIKAHPTDSAYANLGFAYIQQGDDNNAILALNKAIDLNGNFAWAYGLRGYLYTKIDAPELSFNDFSRAIALNAKGGGLSGGQPGASDKSVIRDYTKKIGQDPKDDSAYVQRARAYENLEKNKQAIKDYKKAIALNPENTEAYYGLQNLYLQGKGPEKSPASADYIADTTEQYTETQPFTQLYVTQGTAYSSPEERYALTISDYTKVISLFPENSAAFRDRGYLYAKLNKIDSAIADFTSAITLDPQSAVTLGYRGALYIETNQLEQAIADLSAAIKIDPDALQNYYNRGLAHYQKGAYELAIEDFTVLITKGLLMRWLTVTGAIFIHISINRHWRSLTSQSIDIAPKEAESYAVRGLAYALQKDYKQAVQDFSSSIRLDPRNRTIYVNRALAYKYLNNYKAAIKDIVRRSNWIRMIQKFIRSGERFMSRWGRRSWQMLILRGQEVWIDEQINNLCQYVPLSYYHCIWIR
nr:tetratricopeptide repeat protein [Chitinophaga pinensis]